MKPGALPLILSSIIFSEEGVTSYMTTEIGSFMKRCVPFCEQQFLTTL